MTFMMFMRIRTGFLTLLSPSHIVHCTQFIALIIIHMDNCDLNKVGFILKEFSPLVNTEI